MERLAYSVREAAAALGVSTRTIVREIKRGHLQAVRVSRRVVIPTTALTQYLKNAPEHNVSIPAFADQEHDEATVSRP